MGFELSSATQGYSIKFYNNSGAAIAKGAVVTIDPDGPFEGKVTDPVGATNYASPTDGILPGAALAATATDNQVMGVALHDAEEDAVVECLVFGMVEAICQETGDDASGTSYAPAGTAGSLSEITAGAGTVPVAIQMGASGVTSAGDLRLVFFAGWGAINGTNVLGGD